MKKIAVLFAFLAVVAGCSNDNKISISNLSFGTVYFNFRAVAYEIPVDSTQVISGIPNGTYTYATTFGIPQKVTSYTIEGNAGAGSLSFEQMDTQIHIVYSGFIADSVYQIGATMTSTLSSSSTTSPTSP